MFRQNLFVAAKRPAWSYEVTALRRQVLKTPDDEVDDYLRALAEMAEASGGGIIDPPQAVGDCPDWEDNRILDLASAVGAFLIVSVGADLTSMSPWRGRPIIEPPQFASMIDASAGHAGGDGDDCRTLTVNAGRG